MLLSEIKKIHAIRSNTHRLRHIFPSKARARQNLFTVHDIGPGAQTFGASRFLPLFTFHPPTASSRNPNNRSKLQCATLNRNHPLSGASA